VHAGRTELRSVRDYVERSFAPVAGEKGLDFAIDLAHDAPEQIQTDEQRLQQVLKNLLSNAFKFTDSGSIRLAIGRAPADAHFGSDTLARSEASWRSP
jgi:signal transduction histidine kinase